MTDKLSDLYIETANFIDELIYENTQLKAERDTAVADMEQIVCKGEPCELCNSKNNCRTPSSCPNENYRNWQWCGLEELK